MFRVAALRAARCATQQQFLGSAVVTRAATPMRFMSETRYTASHEWVKVDGGVASIGIADFAQDALGDIVYVELPEVGDELDSEDTFGAVESVKAASDIYSPVSGVVVEVNSALEDDPGLVNGSPEDEGWMIKIELAKPDELNALMDEETYKGFCADGAH